MGSDDKLSTSTANPHPVYFLDDPDLLLTGRFERDGFDLVITGADGRTMARAIRARGAVDPVFVEELDDLAGVLEGVLADGDLVLTMGAGDIGAYAQSLPDLLSNGPSLKVHS